MSVNRPDGVEALPRMDVEVPGSPPECRDRLVERARLEWWLADGGDPTTLAEDFLAAHGVALSDLGRPAAHDPHGTCGAALFLSAAAGA
ncbi:anthranilate synthase component I family protein, partial [Micromonospora chersina]